MDTRTKALDLVEYLNAFAGFAIVDCIDGEYGHMGATIADAILQAGTNYDAVVRPRVRGILESYPEAVTTSAFKRLIDEQGLKTILLWNDDEKPNRILALTQFFLDQGIQTEHDLAAWLADDANRPKLLHVRGVGPKTVDYLKILVGLQTAAVDRYVFRLLEEAGVDVANYDEAREVVNFAADAMEVERAYFDHSIWRYMSQRDKKSSRPCS